MSIDFVKNASNYMNLGVGAFSPYLSGAAKIVVSALVNLDSLSTTNNVNNSILRVMIDGSSTGLALNIDAFTGSVSAGRVRLAGRSVTGETQELKVGVGTVGTGAWKHVGGILDIGGDLIHTILDGVNEGSGAVTFNNTTYTAGTPTSTDAIGKNDNTPPDTADQLDGRLAELAVWIFGAAEAAHNTAELSALNKRYTPDQIKKANLIYYERFLKSPAVDIRNGITGTVTGTLAYAAHPLMRTPRKTLVVAPMAVSTSKVPAMMASYRRRRVA